MAQRIGIIGGSFDPIHIGHLIIATDALEQFSLDRILFLPAHQAPLKAKNAHASPEQRLAMTQLALDGEPRFELCDYDLRAGGTSYSIDTARHLRDAYPDDELLWILGADQIKQLDQWRNIDQLSRLLGFIAFERPGSSLRPPGDLPAHTRIATAKARQLDISSTEIRERLKSGRPSKHFLPAPVFDYIKAHNLYQGTAPANDR